MATYIKVNTNMKALLGICSHAPSSALDEGGGHYTKYDI